MTIHTSVLSVTWQKVAESNRAPAGAHRLQTGSPAIGGTF